MCDVTVFHGLAGFMGSFLEEKKKEKVPRDVREERDPRELSYSK